MNGYRAVTHQKAIHKTWPLPFIPNELTKTIVPFIRSVLRSPEAMTVRRVFPVSRAPTSIWHLLRKVVAKYWQKNGTHLAALPLYSGNALPLFWHCRFATACKPRNHCVLRSGTPIALSLTTESGQPAKVSRHEHQFR
ncbi:hypothetical protein [Pseudomonas viridiflava]|uniref:hypothetical protein n=1 Tax=Pseudomonas viridiflava TaxID=33069 RepID=UPI001C315DA2|nr:hypothetical protein [Pseudomonas viridiflava]QXG39495.1 hypothetical protein KTT55_19250 [Pseudomonas viridiflava]